MREQTKCLFPLLTLINFNANLDIAIVLQLTEQL